MKALTICQPYAHLIGVTREKRIENRTWSTKHRGLLAIHAGKSRAWLQPGDTKRFPKMAFGAIVAVSYLAACLNYASVMCNLVPDEYSWTKDHVHTEGPICWVLRDTFPLPEPIPCRGRQQLWDVPPNIERELRRQINLPPAISITPPPAPPLQLTLFSPLQLQQKGGARGTRKDDARELARDPGPAVRGGWIEENRSPDLRSPHQCAIFRK